MQGRGHWTYDCYYLKHKIQDLINQDLRSPYVSLISHLERGDVKLLQDHLHIIRDNDTIDIESYGQLTLSPIASNIHKTIGLPPQLNLQSGIYSTQSSIVCFDSCHVFNNCFTFL